MGKLVIGCLIFLIGVGSFVSAQEEKEEVIPYNLKAALKSVLNNHRTILATKSDIEAAKLRLKQSRGGYFPSLDVTANYGHENIIKYGPGNNTQLMGRDATAKITQTITDFGLTKSTVETSRLSLISTSIDALLLSMNLTLANKKLSGIFIFCFISFKSTFLNLFNGPLKPCLLS